MRRPDRIVGIHSCCTVRARATEELQGGSERAWRRRGGRVETRLAQGTRRSGRRVQPPRTLLLRSTALLVTARPADDPARGRPDAQPSEVATRRVIGISGDVSEIGFAAPWGWLPLGILDQRRTPIAAIAADEAAALALRASRAWQLHASSCPDIHLPRWACKGRERLQAARCSLQARDGESGRKASSVIQGGVPPP